MESLCNMARCGVEMEKKMENLAKMVEQQGEALGVLQRSVAKLQESVRALGADAKAEAGAKAEAEKKKKYRGVRQDGTTFKAYLVRCKPVPT